MSLFNEELKNISLKELLILIIGLYLIQLILSGLNVVHISSVWIYVTVIIYFIFKLRHGVSSLKNDFLEVFSKNTFSYVLLIVALNIFFSYGMLYLSDFLLEIFPQLNFLVNFPMSSSNSIAAFAGFFATIVISPVSEELIFRGVLINKLKLIVPTTIALLITSLLFASLHSFGSITSAFVFAMCMGILYIKTGNVLVAIFAHFLNNLFAETIVFFDKTAVLFTNDLVISFMSVLAIVSFILISVSIVKEWNKINNNKL